MKIILTGGGTLGSVSPLLAVAEELKKRVQGEELEFLWLGTKDGPERVLVESYGIIFQAISSGKIRRYFSWQNFFDPFRVLAGFWQAVRIMKKFRPDLVLGAGSFVQVPVIYAAAFLARPVIIHQQDIRLGLANKLARKMARRITVAFPKSLQDFPKSKVLLTGNPVRPEILAGSRGKAHEFFKLEANLPTVLVLGGGTGALGLNKVVLQALKELLNFSQVIHVTGAGKGIGGFTGKDLIRERAELNLIIKNNQQWVDNPRYHAYEFLTAEMREAYAAADLVVSRSGMGALTELSVLGKPVILVPLPGHQEENAAYYKKENAAMLLPQKDLTPEGLVQAVKSLLDNPADLTNLSRNIKRMMPADAARKVAEVVLEIIKEARK